MQEHIDKEFKTQGFQKQKLNSIRTGLKDKLFWRDPTEFLKIG